MPMTLITASSPSYCSRGNSDPQVVLALCNFTPVVSRDYRIGVPRAGRWRELLNSDSSIYGGSDQGNYGGVDASPISYQGSALVLGAHDPAPRHYSF
jgi:1,4-alpha-glucan branching enzyme